MKSKIYLFTLLIVFTLTGQAQWVQIDSITLGAVNSINFMNADTGFVHTTAGSLRRTGNGGQTWDSIPITFSGYINDIDFASANVGYAVGGAWFPFGTNYPFAILKTTDGGFSWDSIYSGTNGGLFTHVSALSDNEFYATSPPAMVHSDDGGLTFDTVIVSKSLPAGAEEYSRVRFLNATKGYVMGRAAFFVGHRVNLYETNDGGKTWQIIHTDSVTNFINDFVMTPSGNGIIVGNGSYLLRTTNGGNTWQTVPMANANVLLYQVEEVGGFLYAMGSDASDTTSCMFYSPDWGTTWQKQFSRKASAGGIVDMSITPSGVGYFSTWRNVFKNDKLVSLQEAVSRGFELYPNPAKDVVYIKLPNSGAAAVYVYNSLGQKVRELVIEGSSTFEFNVSSLTAGIYVLEIQQGRTGFTKKLIKE